MHCISKILRAQMNRITNSNRCWIIRQLLSGCSINRTLYSIMTVRQLGECLNVTISQSWIVVLSLSHVAMYLTYLCTDSTSIWGVARHYLFTVLNVALSLPHVAIYLTCTCTDSTPMEGVLKSYHFTVVNGRTVIPNMYVCVTCF